MPMEINIQISPADHGSALQTFVENKVAKLEQFLDEITGSEIALLEDSSTDRNNKVCSLRISAGQKTFVVESRSNSFERATLEAIQRIIHHVKRIQQYYR